MEVGRGHGPGGLGKTGVMDGVEAVFYIATAVSAISVAAALLALYRLLQRTKSARGDMSDVLIEAGKKRRRPADKPIEVRVPADQVVSRP